MLEGTCNLRWTFDGVAYSRRVRSADVHKALGVSLHSAHEIAELNLGAIEYALHEALIQLTLGGLTK